MAFLSVQRTMRSRPSTQPATKARPERNRRAKRLRAVETTPDQPSTPAVTPAELLLKITPIRPKPYATRARAAGGPEDHALYRCDCGYAFEADVTAAVDCPHCGTEQTW